MIHEYNPFKPKGNESTEHGIINYQHNMGTTYVTHRRKEHYFKKFQGFAISNSELEIAYNKRVHWIMIMYHKEDGTTETYRITMEEAQNLTEYNNNEDIQKVFPTKIMQKHNEENWE